VKTYINTFHGAVSEGNIEKAKLLLPVITKEIDKAVSSGVLHKNNGSRKISRLSSLLFRIDNENPTG